MIKDHKDILQIKRYDKCSESHKIAVDRQGNLIPLDINRKKHHCNSAKHEEKIVKIYDDIESLSIPDEKSASSHQSHVLSSTSEVSSEKIRG